MLQVPDHGRALSEGTVLCMEDRRVVGAVEEVFGPILSPLYAFRWAGRGQQAAEVAAGTRVFTTARLAHYVAEESLQTKVSAQPGGQQLAALLRLGQVSVPSLGHLAWPHVPAEEGSARPGACPAQPLRITGAARVASACCGTGTDIQRVSGACGMQHAGPSPSDQLLHSMVCHGCPLQPEAWMFEHV